MENEILQIVEKIKTMFKYDTTLKDIVRCSPSASLDIKDGKVILNRICFAYYDTLFVYPNGIIYSPEHGSSKEILKYENFEELLKM